MILNDYAAIRSFSEAGSITLGGNVSVAAGPLGRNAEASGQLSTKGVAGIFSYSQTKGLFAGVSLEGSVIIERKDANKKFYGGPVSAKQLLGGNIEPPASAEELYRILNSRAFNIRGQNFSEDIYNDIPAQQVWAQERSPTYADSRPPTAAYSDNRDSRSTFRPRSSTWQDELSTSRFRDSDYSQGYSDDVAAPRRKSLQPTPLQRASTLKPDQAIALYTFKAGELMPFSCMEVFTNGFSRGW